MRTINLILIIIAIIGDAWFEHYATGHETYSVSKYTFWIAAPYLALILPVLAWKNTVFQRAIFMTLLVFVPGGFYIYFDTLFIHPDAQGALIFLFLPFYQLVALGVVLVITLVVIFLGRKPVEELPNP